MPKRCFEYTQWLKLIQIAPNFLVMTVVHRRTPSFRIKPEKESAAFSRNLKEDGIAVTQASITALNQEQKW